MKKTGAITILKGQATVVATDSQKTYTNITGNPGMATAGSGDVLTGIIAGLMGQKKALRRENLSAGGGLMRSVYTCRRRGPGGRGDRRIRSYRRRYSLLYGYGLKKYFRLDIHTTKELKTKGVLDLIVKRGICFC